MYAWEDFSNISNILKNGLNEPKTQISLLPRLGYSWIKIDHIADSLLKLQIEIGVHLINVELSQLLTLQKQNLLQKKILRTNTFLKVWLNLTMFH